VGKVMALPEVGGLHHHYGFCRKFSFDSIWGMISLCHGGL
jgi:hypothetical protein